MEPFEVRVTDIRRPEFMQAAGRLGLRYYFPLALLVVVVSVVLILVTEDFSAASVGFPLLVIVAAPPVYVLLARQNFKRLDQSTMDVAYHIDEKGWRVTAGENTSVFAWESTYRVRETRDTFLLYDTKTTSSMLPKRLMTEGQQGFLRSKKRK